jgi:hypothetical protein
MRTEFLKGLTVFSIVASLAVGAVVYRQDSGRLDDPTSRPVQSWSPQAGQDAPLEFAEAQPRTYPDTFARPVFSATRRPFVPPPPPAPPEPAPVAELPPPAPAAAPDPGHFQLKGIMIGDATAKALVVSPESPAGQWLTVGATVMGWKLTRIGDDAVSLNSGAGTVELKLYVDNRPK